MTRKDKDQLPKIIQEYGLDFHWDNKKVWALDVPVEEMDISELEWQFDFPFWDMPPRRYVITPNQVMNDPETYKDEYQRIINADMGHPLDIMKNQKDMWEMLDGLHRLVKARLEGKTKVRVRKIPRSAIPELHE